MTKPSHHLHTSPVWWKRYLGVTCPHGLEIVLVNGSHVRNTYDSDFVQGNNSHASAFVPEGELWIDESLPETEWPFVAFHECHEAEDMRKGMSYDKAHDRAKKLEDIERRHALPGEPFRNRSSKRFQKARP